MGEIRELPAAGEALTAFNLERWEEVLANPELRKVTGRVETDRFGRILVSPPAAYEDGGYQFRLGRLLEELMSGGRVTVECPISTAGGVRVADVAWASEVFESNLPANLVCLPNAPEICVEVASPSNTRQELEEKRNLYFAAGAKEYWLCVGGDMHFFVGDGEQCSSGIRFVSSVSEEHQALVKLE